MLKLKRGTPFNKAAVLWLESKRPPFNSSRNYSQYKLHVGTLGKFFKKRPLNRISADDIRKYQRHRLSECAKKGKHSGHHTINSECGVLRQILKKGQRWIKVQDDYVPLPLPHKSPGKALTDEMRNKLFESSLGDAECLSAYLAAGIAINTTGGPKEISTIRLGDINLKQRRLTIRGSKNEFRVRIVGINDDCLKYLLPAIERSKACGSVSPDDHLFPFRVKKNVWDPTRRQTDFKWGWKKMRAAAGMPKLRFYDLRHHSSTVLLEDEESSEETVESIAGRVTEEMKRWYSHIRIHRIQHAMQALEPGGRIKRNVLASNMPLSNKDIVELLSYLPSELVLAKMDATAANYDTSVEGLRFLKRAAVPNQIVTRMINTMMTITKVQRSKPVWFNDREKLKESIGPRELKYDKDRLAKEVWQMPLEKLAPEYGLSDVGLRKVCIKFRIALPGRGYWLQKKA